MISMAIRVARLGAPLGWALAGAAAVWGFLPVGVVVVLTGLLLTAGTRDAIFATDQHDKSVLIRAVAGLSAQAAAELHPVLHRVP